MKNRDFKKFINEMNRRDEYATKLIWESKGVAIELGTLARSIITDINSKIKNYETNDNVSILDGFVFFEYELAEGVVFKLYYSVVNTKTEAEYAAATTEYKTINDYSEINNEFHVRFFALNNKIPVDKENTESLVHELEHMHQHFKMGTRGKLLNNEDLYNFAREEYKTSVSNSIEFIVGFSIYLTEYAEMNAYLQSFAEFLRCDPYGYYNSRTYRMVGLLGRYLKTLKKLPKEQKEAITQKYLPHGITFSKILKRITNGISYYNYKIGMILSYHFPNGLIDIAKECLDRELKKNGKRRK